MPALSVHLLFAALLAAVLLLPRRLAFAAGAGLAAFALGAAAFVVVPGIAEVSALAARLATLGFSAAFVGGNVGLMLLGAGGVVAAGLMAASAEGAARVGGVTAAAIGIAVLVAMVPLLRVAGLAAAVAALVVGGAGALVAWGAAALRRIGRGGAATAEHPRASDALPRGPVAVATAAGVTALAAPHAGAIVLAALVAAVAAHVAARCARRVPAVPVLPLVAAVGLVPFLWLLATIAGPVGLATATLPLVPLSVPAQALLVPLLLLGAWGFLGAGPLHRWVPGAVLAPVAGALLLRVGAPALGAGLEHLQPALFAAAVAAAWHAAVTRRPAVFAACAGLLAVAGIFTAAHVAPGARVGAAVLFAVAPVVVVLGAADARSTAGAARAAHETVARLAAFAAGLAIYAAIHAGLRAEVVLTVLFAAAAAAGAWRLRAPAVAPPTGPTILPLDT